LFVIVDYFFFFFLKWESGTSSELSGYSDRVEELFFDRNNMLVLP